MLSDTGILIIAVALVIIVIALCLTFIYYQRQETKRNKDNNDAATKSAEILANSQQGSHTLTHGDVNANIEDGKPSIHIHQSEKQSVLTKICSTLSGLVSININTKKDD